MGIKDKKRKGNREGINRKKKSKERTCLRERHANMKGSKDWELNRKDKIVIRKVEFLPRVI